MKEKQKELKNWLEKLGISGNEFAKRFYYETIDSELFEAEEQKAVKKFQDQFKKALQRETTKDELLDKYLNFLYEQEEFKKKDLVKPNCIFSNEFDKEFNKKMKQISKNITETITKENNE